MTIFTAVRRDPRIPIGVAGTAALAMLALFYGSGLPAQAADADTPVGLATTSQFGVLAGSGITNVGAGTTIDGDVGSYETPAVTGLLETQVDGEIRRSDLNPGDESIMVTAKDDLVAAYLDAADSDELAEPDLDETELGGKTLTAGIYQNATLGLTGTLTLDGGNDDGTPSDSVFVIKTRSGGSEGSTLTTASDSSVVLTGGAQACNVFWQVGSSATFGARTEFVGTVMALTSISAESGATFEGRLLARNGEVTLINNTISSPGCEQAVDDDTDGTDTDSDTDADGADTDSDGTDADGTDTDTDGTDTDADGTDADTAGGDADSGTDADATGEASADSDTTGGGSTGGTTANPDLPDTGGQNLWAVLLGAASLVAGTVLVGRRRYRPTHAR